MASGDTSDADAFGDLASTLWRVREMLNTLLFKIVEERVLSDADQSGWLAVAHREVETALDEVRTLEVVRAAKSAALADQLGLPRHATLSALVAAAPARWATVYADHRAGLRELVAEISTLANTGSLPRREPDQELRPDAVLAAVDSTLADLARISAGDFLD